jgi:hypothetical protein
LREAARIGVACAAVTVLALTLLVGSGTSRQAAGRSVVAAQRTVTTRARPSTSPTGASVPSHRPPAAPVRVRTLTVTLTDPARTISGASATVPRSFATVIRYPSQNGVAPRPLPLIVFGHGFEATGRAASLGTVLVGESTQEPASGCTEADRQVHAPRAAGAPPRLVSVQLGGNRPASLSQGTHSALPAVPLRSTRDASTGEMRQAPLVAPSRCSRDTIRSL